MKGKFLTAFKNIMKAFHCADMEAGKRCAVTVLALLVLTFMAMPARADQISPNPNPAGGTITVTGNDTNGTVFDNNGTIDVTNTGILTNNAGATMNNNGGATITNAGTLTSVENSGFSNNGTISNSNGATINVGTSSTTGNEIILDNYGTITNDGTLHIKRLKGGYINQEFNRLINNIGGSLVNNGILRADTYNCFGAGCDTWGIIENHGNFYNSATGNADIMGWLLNGTHLAGPGLLPIINPNATVINDGTMTIGQALSNSAIMTNNGTLSGIGNWFNDAADAVFNNSGTMSLRFYRNSGTLNNNEAGIINANNGLENLNGATINNAGTMNIGNAWLYNYAGASLINTGTLNNSCIFLNAGTLELAAGSTYNFTGGTLDNVGDFVLRRNFTFGEAVAGTVNLDAGGTVHNYATLTNAAGHTQDNNGIINNYAGGVFHNNGTLNNSTGASLGNSGLFANNNTLNNDGSISNNAGGVLINNGALNNAGTIGNAGLLELAAGSTYNFTGGTLDNVGDFVLRRNFTFGEAVAGTVNLNAGGTVHNYATLINAAGHAQDNNGIINNYAGGVFQNNGTLNNNTGAYLANSGLLINNSTLNNAGTLELASGSTYNFTGGTLDNAGDFVLRRNFTFGEAAAGTVNLNAGGTVHNYATLTNAAGHTQDNSGIINNYAGGVFQNNGTLNNNTGASLVNSGLLVNNNTLNNADNITNSAGAALINTGTLNNAGTIGNAGLLELAAGSTYNFTGGTLNNNNGGLLVLNRDYALNGTDGGTVNMNAGGTVHNYATLTNADGHTQVNNGSINNYAGGVLENNGTLNNAATAEMVNSGLLNNSGNLNNAGAIVNAGSLNNNAGATMVNTGNLVNSSAINNAGTLELAAGSTYNFTGGTLNNNNGGLLVLNRDYALNGTDGGTVNMNAGGTVQNNTILNIAPGHTQVNNGNLTNSAGAILANSGNLVNNSTLSNNGTFSNDGLLNNTSGANIVSNGNLANNAGAVFVNNGTFNTATTFTNNGTFMGTGTTIGNVVNNGILSPGNSIGTMNITGNFTSNSGSVYRVETNPDGQADKLNVSGTATLNGGTVSVMAGSGVYNILTSYRYNILTAGSVVGTFGNLTSDLAFLTPSLSYDPMNVWLTLFRNATSFCDVAGTPNQSSVACTLDQTHTTPDMLYVMNALLNLNAAGARHAFDQMNGNIHIAMMESTNYALSRYVDTLSGRMDGFGAPGASFANAGNLMLASRDDAGSDAGNIIVAAVNNIKNGGTRGNAKDISPWGLWAKGYGNLGSRSGDEISAKYDYRGGGLLIGFDRKISDSFLVGVAGGYSYTKVSMSDLNENGNVQGYQGSVYGAYNGGRMYAKALAAYGYNRYETNRDIAFSYISRTAQGNYDGHILNGYAEVGYHLPVSSLNIIPMASLQAGSMWRNHFEESDAGALNLSVDREYITSIVGSLGVKLNREFKVGKGTITPELRVKWLHEFAENDYSQTNVFISDPVSSFTIHGEGAKRDSLAVGLGLTWEIGKNIGLALSYDASIGGSHTNHSGMLGAVYRW